LNTYTLAFTKRQERTPGKLPPLYFQNPSPYTTISINLEWQFSKPEEQTMTLYKIRVNSKSFKKQLKIPLSIHVAAILLFIAITLWYGPVEAYFAL